MCLAEKAGMKKILETKPNPAVLKAIEIQHASATGSSSD